MKKTLLIAVAALGISGINSQAQVYSQNIVGYANVPTTVSGGQYLLAVPFKMGVSNGANEVFGSTLPDFTTLLLWSTPLNKFTLYYADSSSPTGWDDDNFGPVPAPTLPVGQGFFLSPNGSVTNTFAGTIAINVGTSNIMSLPVSGAQYLVGGVVPYAGSVTNGTTSGGGLNLNGLPDFTTVLQWSTALNKFTLFYADSSSPTGWDDDNFGPVPAPTLNVADGFFVSPNGSATWTTGL